MGEPKWLWGGEMKEYRPFRHRNLKVDEYMAIHIGSRSVLLGRDKKHPGMYGLTFRRKTKGETKEICLAVTEEALQALEMMRRKYRSK